MGVVFRLIIALAVTIAIASATCCKDIKAEEVMDALHRYSSVNIDGYTVKGDLDLSLLPEDGRGITAPLSITNSTINGNLNFRNAALHEGIIISNSEIDGIVDLRGTQFYGIASFEKTKFNNISDFGSACFLQEACFDNSVFNDIADFSGAQFDGFAGFVNSEFGNITYFDSALFQQDAHFENSSFNSTVDFNRSQFNGNIFFGDYSNPHNGSRFKGKAYFELARFDGYASFMGSSFSDDADFWQSDFGDYIDFGETDFHNTTSFNWATFKKQAYFSNSSFLGNANFYGSQFESDAMFDGAEFFSNLTLNWTRYKKMYIRWNSIGNLISDDAGYMSLIRNFKDLGYFEDADDCYYRFRVEQFEREYLGGTSPDGWIENLVQYLPEFLPASFDLLAMIFYGYGVKPLYPLIWSVSSILLFGFIWMMGGLNAVIDNQGIFERYGSNQVKPSKKQTVAGNLVGMLSSLLNAMNFSVIVFLSGTKFFIDPPEIPYVQRLPKTLTKCIFIAERVLGGFFSILLFIAINATVVRQVS
ncbi:MAG: hypothetical protein A4E49_02599 [Methanosaeta sp. PtaU1.Bin112]|nr:MAG: hypothetical protein A4E49_02599 [Methanosaeta sp. PtaU1.Bin112]